MNNIRRCQVLLLSAIPQAHDGLLHSLAQCGITAYAVCGAREAEGWLSREPEIVLVDLVHGSGVDSESIETINRRRGRALVLALHAGEFGDFQEEVAGLNVDGFCRAGDWRPIAEATPQQHVSLALH